MFNLVRKHMYVNERERLSNFTLTKIKEVFKHPLLGKKCYY